MEFLPAPLSSVRQVQQKGSWVRVGESCGLFINAQQGEVGGSPSLRRGRAPALRPVVPENFVFRPVYFLV